MLEIRKNRVANSEYRMPNAECRKCTNNRLIAICNAFRMIVAGNMEFTHHASRITHHASRTSCRIPRPASRTPHLAFVDDFSLLAVKIDANTIF
jgi:glycine cleavage system pyridoxal-binding protein P